MRSELYGPAAEGIPSPAYEPPTARREYPSRKLVAETLAEVVRRAVMDADCEHPEDLSCAALTAIEGAEVTLTVLWEKGLL